MKKKRQLRPSIRKTLDYIELIFVVLMSAYMVFRIMMWGIGL